MKAQHLSVLMVLFTAPILQAAEKMSIEASYNVNQQLKRLNKTTVIVEFYQPSKTARSSNNIGQDTLKGLVAEAQVAITNFRSSIGEELRKNIQHQYQYVPAALISVDQDLLSELKSNPNIKAIYENKRLKPSLAESVELVYPSHATSRFSGKGWAIAILDTGVDKNHSFLTNGASTNVISEACYSGGKGKLEDFSSYPEVEPLCPGSDKTESTATNSGLHCTGYPGCAHGTHVAGIAAGNTGVATEANVIAIQVFTGIIDYFNDNVCGTGVGESCLLAFDSDILKGLERVYALRHTHQIASVNLSLGGGKFYGHCNAENQLITDMIVNLKSAGIATAVASGNEYFINSVGFPACITSAITVGATYDSGPYTDEETVYSNESALLDLYAPGSYIISSVPGGGTSSYQGTSMAAPHVAGAFAVLQQKNAKLKNKKLSIADLENVLKSVGPQVTSYSGYIRRRIAVDAALAEIPNSFIITPILKLLLLDN